MCLITNQQEPKIAQEDITVYKNLFKIGNVFQSIFNKFEWKLGELYRTKIEESPDWCSYDDTDNNYLNANYNGWTRRSHEELKCFGSGFHSAKKGRLRTYGSEILVECTIPKGSEYYEDFTGLYVSNQIIINKVVSNQQWLWGQFSTHELTVNI